MNDRPADNRSNYLPDFCNGILVIELVVFAQLVAFVLVLARANNQVDPWTDLIRVSLFVQWLGLVSAASLCALRRYADGLSRTQISLLAYALLLLVTVLLSALAYQIASLAGANAILPPSMSRFVWGNFSISVILSAVVLRYFYVQDQWKRNIERQAGARVEALEARMRPHFLFNTMNTIAALIRTQPQHAERAIEDLSDLLRASLNDPGQMITLAEELEIARHYVAIEKLRLGDRLDVVWNIAAAPGELRVPRLILQPLIENAVFHGIEQHAATGTIRVEGRVAEQCVELEVASPIPDETSDEHQGLHMATDNVRERLQLAFGKSAELQTRTNGGTYHAVITLPITGGGA